MIRASHVEYRDLPDKLGRCSFYLFWPCSAVPGGQRAQIFFSDPADYGLPAPTAAIVGEKLVVADVVKAAGGAR